MDITDKIDNLFEDSRTSRFKDMKAIRQELKFLEEELGQGIDTLVGKRTAFDNLEDITFLEHYVVRAMRSLPKLDKQLKAFQKSLKMKIDFLKKQEK